METCMTCDTCEGCGQAAVTADSDGVPLCAACYDALPLVEDDPDGIMYDHPDTPRPGGE